MAKKAKRKVKRSVSKASRSPVDFIFLLAASVVGLALIAYYLLMR